MIVLSRAIRGSLRVSKGISGSRWSWIGRILGLLRTVGALGGAGPVRTSAQDLGLFFVDVGRIWVRTLVPGGLGGERFPLAEDILSSLWRILLEEERRIRRIRALTIYKVNAQEHPSHRSPIGKLRMHG